VLFPSSYTPDISACADGKVEVMLKLTISQAQAPASLLKKPFQTLALVQDRFSFAVLLNLLGFRLFLAHVDSITCNLLDATVRGDAAG